MKKLVILALFLVAAGVAWKTVSQSDGDDALAELRHRLDAAERSFQQAGRAAGMAGLDTTAQAASARTEIEEVERTLRDRLRSAKSGEERTTIEALLQRAAVLKRRME